MLVLVSAYMGTLASFAQYKLGTHLCDSLPKFCGKENWLYESETPLVGPPVQIMYIPTSQSIYPGIKMLLDWKCT